MTTRRAVLAGMAATLLPVPTWADAGSPACLAAAKVTDDSFALFGLTAEGAEVFRLPLPDRGHAAAAHPSRPEAVAFARRPGTFALVIDCRDGREIARLTAADGRHFYGHGAYSADGALLFTPENDYEGNRGMVGVRDAAKGYVQIAEFHSGGVGPHDFLRLPDGSFAVANGGLSSHPDAGDDDFGIAEMRPNLTYLTPEGLIDETIELPADLRRNSIRHLAVREDGLLAFALQWSGDKSRPVPLIGLHQRGEAPRLLSDAGTQAAMKGYGGSIAFSGDGTRVAVTSSKGGLAQVFDVETGAFLGALHAADICGLARGPVDFIGTTGAGRILGFASDAVQWDTPHGAAWDNHLVRL